MCKVGTSGVLCVKARNTCPSVCLFFDFFLREGGRGDGGNWGFRVQGFRV